MLEVREEHKTVQVNRQWAVLSVHGKVRGGGGGFVINCAEQTVCRITDFEI